ncbi:hypothetical protein ACQ4M3_40540 [Leptolyngbya sp. AN03gr2]|uniref:hypothetical protein n=1 Tax=unclassified Leptolyngbya TaxID=2650499 RepID=UPI003D3182FE
MGTSWAVVSTFVIAGELSGAAAISATVSAIGGATAMTGGAAFIAFAVSLGFWTLFKNNDAELEKVVKLSEPALYMIAQSDEEKIAIFPAIREHFDQFRSSADQSYWGHHIAIGKLANAMSKYVFLDRYEKVLALVDVSF